VLAVVLAILRGQLNLTTEVLAVLVAVIAVALLGGLAPAAPRAGWPAQITRPCDAGSPCWA
jgi:hypothetical protein